MNVKNPIKKTCILFTVVFLLTFLNPFYANAGDFSIYFSFRSSDSDLYIAGGSAVAVGLSVAIYHSYRMSKKERGNKSMYASALTFDINSMNGYEIKFDEDTIYVPLFQWRF